jgi:lipopolysaccharide export system protein LptA
VIATLALLAALSAPPALAKLPAAGGGELTVSARQFRYNFQKRQLEYEGEPVRVTRGDSVLTCKRLSAQLDEAGQVTRGVCQGDVRFVRADKVVLCEKATYEAAAARLTCEGKPTIQSGTISATGALLVYDLDKDEVTMTESVGKMPSAQVDQLQATQEKKKKKAGGSKP